MAQNSTRGQEKKKNEARKNQWSKRYSLMVVRTRCAPNGCEHVSSEVAEAGVMVVPALIKATTHWKFVNYSKSNF
jgi:hypothetical protein